MAFGFNLDEILEMAEELEKNGEKFYLKAASLFGDKAVNNLLKDLADKESIHRSFFAELRREVSDPERLISTFDPEGLTEFYLKAMADSHVFPVNMNLKGVFREAESLKDILELAIKFEKESILFFLGIKEFIVKEQGKDKIDLLVKEEMKHISDLKKLFLST